MPAFGATPHHGDFGHLDDYGHKTIVAGCTDELAHLAMPFRPAGMKLQNGLASGSHFSLFSSRW
jgi:hypothetical protein